MLKRLLLGLLIGLVVGVGIAAILVKAIGMQVWIPVAAYLIAALAGAITGMVAGKPIWAKGGAIEAGLKAFFGALIATGGMFALRQWAGGLQPDLSSLQAGSGPIGDLPAVSLPIITAVLGAFFGLDNTPGEEEGKDAKGAAKKGAPASVAGKRRVAAPELEEDLEEEVPPKRAKR